MNEVVKVSIDFLILYSGYCAAGVCFSLLRNQTNLTFVPWCSSFQFRRMNDSFLGNEIGYDTGSVNNDPPHMAMRKIGKRLKKGGCRMMLLIWATSLAILSCRRL